MTQEFLTEVRSIVEPLLTRLGFQLDAFVDDVDEGGRRGSAVFYGSKDCKIQVYRTTREGSVNCMIAPLGAPCYFWSLRSVQEVAIPSPVRDKTRDSA